MSEIFMNPSRLVVSNLGPATPAGLFLVYSHPSRIRRFYVTGGEGPRHAIVLETSEPHYAFQAWPLTDELPLIVGVSLGDVEPLVDVEVGVSYPSPRPPIGMLWIGRGKLCIGARPESGVGSMSVQIGNAPPTESIEGAVFRRWQLIQRDHDGKPIVLFRTGDPDSVGEQI